MSRSKIFFLDTFTHESTEDLNLDLVQFHYEVVIREIRVIPLGAKVDINSIGTRLGATNPSSFHIEAFANNRRNAGSSTFQRIGSLDYHEKDIQMVIDKPNLTDCLIIKGNYTAITIAVFGYLKEEVTSDTNEPRDTLKEAAVCLPPVVKAVGKPEVIQKETNASVLGSSSASVSAEPVTHALTEEAESDDQEMYTEEDVLAGDIITTDETGYDEGYEMYTDLSAFNPYQFEMTQLLTYANPAMSSYVKERIKLRRTSTLNDYADNLLEVCETYKSEPHHSSWVLALERLIETLHLALASLSVVDPANFDATIQTLISWALEALNVQSAMAQPDTAFKVRHLKMGIKLCDRMLTMYDSLTYELLDQGVEEQLFSLFTSPYMATSLRLLIVKALDGLTSTSAGASWFVGEHQTGFKRNKSGYQRLLDIMLTKQNARVVVAVSTLIKKLHMYETLKHLQSAANKVAEKTFELMRSSEVTPDLTEQEGYKVAALPSAIPYKELDRSECDLLVTYLNDVKTTIRNAKHLIAQQAQSTLPAVKQFRISSSSSDPLPGLFTLLSSCKLLETIFVLLASTFTGNHAEVFISVKELLEELMNTQAGLLYIGTNTVTVNGLIRLLLQTNELDKEQDIDENSAQTLGFQLVHCLQALQFVDQLKTFQQSQQPEERVIDEPELLNVLQAMFCFTIVPIGRESLVKVLNWDIQPLVDIIRLTGVPETDKIIGLSASMKYVADILEMVLMYTEDVSVLEPKFQSIISLAKTEDSSAPLANVMEWLEPYKQLSNLDFNCSSALAKSFHSYVEQLPKIEVGLVSCLRIMSKIALASCREDMPGFVCEELSYQRALLDLYSEDCLTGWIKILERLSEKRLYSWQRGEVLSTSEHDLLLFIIKPTLKLVHSIISRLIAARGTDYQDASALKPLYKTFTVICSVPIGHVESEVNEIQKLIIDILLCYTQPDISGTDSQVNDAMATSLWTCMIKQLVEHTLSHPCNYMGGVLMLSELLPVTLPIQCQQPLSEEEITKTVNSRTLWSAHLLPLLKELEAFVTNLAGSSCLHLQHAIRRFCWQLSDLNSHFAQFMMKTLMKAFSTYLAEGNKTVGDGNTTEEVAACSKDTAAKYESDAVTTNILGVLAYLTQQAPAKTAFLCLLRASETESDNFMDMFDSLLHTLNHVSETSSHNQSQELIVSTLQSLCDIELSLVEDLDSITLEYQLTNDLPDNKTLEKIITALLEHISNYDHCYTSILLSLRTLLIFTEHNYTFYYLKKTLLSDSSRAMYNLFTRLNNTFSKDSSDCISTLSTALELMRVLITPTVTTEGEDNSEVNQQHNIHHAFKTQPVTAQQLAVIVNWKVQPHALDDLEKLLVDLREESLELIVSNITCINQLLKQSSDNQDPASSQEGPSTPTCEEMDVTEEKFVLPEPRPSQELFSKRAIYVLTEPDTDKLSPAYWLTNLMADDSHIEEADDRVTKDLLLLCEQSIKDFNLEDELKKKETGNDSLAKVTVTHTRKNEVLALGQAGTEFKAPMRGIGVMRRGQQRGRISNRGRDPFRDRAQNTSRPPSMHVDDFVKMATNPSSEEELHQAAERPQFPPRERGRGGYDRGRGRQRFLTTPDGFSPSYRGARGRGAPPGIISPHNRSNMYNNHGLRNLDRFAAVRSTAMSGRIDRRSYAAPPNTGRYSQQTGDRRYSPRVGGQEMMMSGRGRGYNRDSRLGSSSTGSRDRDRDRVHYRSYTK